MGLRPCFFCNQWLGGLDRIQRNQQYEVKIQSLHFSTVMELPGPKEEAYLDRTIATFPNHIMLDVVR
jgi:hypothetical protein